ncbi:hypothetical protein PUN28_015935 [Cardiocondyla obscurior]|uniref:Uncharacterized protein n=1 Tax=Cardiocondyla obscurior TaxID=286306 RepID=A0AAW2EW24_9HYME
MQLAFADTADWYRYNSIVSRLRSVSREKCLRNYVSRDTFCTCHAIYFSCYALNSSRKRHVTLAMLTLCNCFNARRRISLLKLKVNFR